MSTYPEVVFPTHTRKYNRKNQRMFDDYGCLEAIHIDMTENNPCLLVKKNRLIDLSSDVFSTQSVESIDQKILMSVHDFLTLGDPDPVQGLVDDDIDDSASFDFNYSGGKSKFRVLDTTTVHDQVANVILDCPDIAYNTLDELMKECHDPRSDLKLITHSKLVHHIDPTLCDVGKKLINKLAENESQVNLREQYCDRDFTGGCLAYQCLQRRMNKQVGVLICPQGQALDELSLKMVQIDTSGEGIDDAVEYDVDRAIPNIRIGPEIRQTLNGRVLQIDTAPFERQNDFLFGTRSDYHVLLSSFSCNSCTWNWEENRVEYDNKHATSALGSLRTAGSCHLSCIALSPYIPGECAFATENGIVRLWNVNIDSEAVSETLQVLLGASSELLQSANAWKHVSFAAHPKQLYVADSDCLHLFDMRTRNSSLSILNVFGSSHAHPHEKIYCVESCRNIENEHECLVATDRNLFVMDQRHCGEPLIQLGSNTSFPPAYIKAVAISDAKCDLEWSALNRTHSTFSVIMGVQRSQEVYLYQLCKVKSITKLQPARYPYQSIGPPMILDGYRSLSRYVDTCEFSDYLRHRLAKTTLGLQMIQVQIPDKHQFTDGLIVLQMNSVGDIGFQTLSMQDPENVPFRSDVITGKTGIKDRTNKNELEFLTRENYRRWINLVTLKNPALHNKATITTASSRKHTFAHEESKLHSDRLPVAIMQSIPPSQCCQLCSAVRGKDGSALPNCITCQRCGMDTSASQQILKLFSDNKILVQAYEMNCENPPLCLLNTEYIEDEIYDDEMGRLLKATWKFSYEEYWQSQSSLEKKREVEENRVQKKSIFDLDQGVHDASIAEADQLINIECLTSNIDQISSAGPRERRPKRSNIHPMHASYCRMSSKSQPLVSPGRWIGESVPSSPLHGSASTSKANAFFSPRKRKRGGHLPPQKSLGF